MSKPVSDKKVVKALIDICLSDVITSYSIHYTKLYDMMALTFSGLTFPQEGMPMVAKVYSWIFPYTPWLKGFMEQSLKGIPVTYSLKWLGILCVYCVIGLASLPLLKQKLAHQKHWGKH